jgi:hypothetical protein
MAARREEAIARKQVAMTEGKLYSQSDLDAALALFAGQVAEHIPCVKSDERGYQFWPACSCGFNQDGEIEDLVEFETKWKQHILSLVPNTNAIQEHDAALVAREQIGRESAIAYHGGQAAYWKQEYAALKAQIASAEATRMKEFIEFRRILGLSNKDQQDWIKKRIAELEQQAEAKEEKCEF